MKKKYLNQILNIIEKSESLSDKFHSLSNNKRVFAGQTKNMPDSWTKTYFKTYPRLNSIKLNPKLLNNRLEIIMRKRRSIRKFTNKPILKKDLGYLLYASSGLITSNNDINKTMRPYPSAGARYPLEIYPLIFNCRGIEKGLYHYNLKQNSLELLLKEDLRSWLFKVTGGEKWLQNSSVTFIITGVLDRTRIKYGDRGYRYTLIETGHLAQNVMLLATELGLGSCAIGGYIDNDIDILLDINIQKEHTLYLITIGKI